jgi:endonuclease/exonuclease/phosphatase family metal-dependent hydrolase
MRRLKILSYNIHSCFGIDRRYRPQRVRDVILSAEADVVALQEVDSSLEVIDGVDQLTYLAQETGMFAVIGPTLRRGYGAYGNAFLSRRPLEDVFETNLTYRRFEPRGMLKAEIGVEEGRVRIINTHLGLKLWERRFQVERVLQEVDWRPQHPTIVMGDFNEWFPWSVNMRRLLRHFGPTPRVPTFPSRWPRLALDRIFVHPQPAEFRFCALTGKDARIASDHLPVLAEVGFA